MALMVLIGKITKVLENGESVNAIINHLSNVCKYIMPFLFADDTNFIQLW